MQEDANNSTPPPLPPRDEAVESHQLPPKTPDKDTKPKLAVEVNHQNRTPLAYNLHDDLSVICVSRELELYSSPLMNENSDIFGSSESAPILINRKLQELADDIVIDDFWTEIITESENRFVRNGKVKLLEEKIELGIPENLRSIVYLKTLRVQYTPNKDTYTKLLRKANASDLIKNLGAFFETLKVESSFKEVLKVFSYYNSEVTISKTNRIEGNDKTSEILYESSQHLPPNNFILNTGKIISSFPGLSNEEQLLILLKFNKLFTNLIKDEFFYKTNRSLETLVPSEFVHITKQGIQLTKFHKSFLLNFIAELDHLDISANLLDFVLFEGFDFVIRLIVYLFNANSVEIMKLEGDELAKFLLSQEFFNIKSINISDIFIFQPEIVKFENEYHLLNANSMTNNHHELLKLKEVNEDLAIKIKEIKNLLKNLELTHNEILEQSESYKKQLDSAQLENEKLVKIRDEIKSQYESLSMKENVQNTIKANEEFESRNLELEAQIEQLKLSIAGKKAKLEKMS